MARIAFLNIPAHGHTNPTLPLVEQLRHRGHEVHYWSFGAFGPAIERAGAIFHDCESLYPFDYTRLDTNLFRLAAFILETTRIILPPLEEQVAAVRPDFLMHDSLAPWGRGIAGRLRLPSACSVTTFAMNNLVVASAPTQVGNLLRMAPGALYRLPAYLRARRALRRDVGLHVPSILSVFSNPGPLNIVYTSRAVQPGAGTFGRHWRFVGATVSSHRERESWPPEGHELPHRPLVYISLGTLFNEAPAFYRLCLDAFEGAPFDVLLAVGNKVDLAEIGHPPANVRIERFVPQIGVLKRAALFLTHAGMNSVHESLLAGVPMLLAPQAADQEWVAQRMARLGAGRILRIERLTAQGLRSAVEGALRDTSLQDRARALGETLRAAGGPPAAVDAIEAAISAQGTAATVRA